MSNFAAGTTNHQREHKLPRVTAVKNKQAAPTQVSCHGIVDCLHVFQAVIQGMLWQLGCQDVSNPVS
jgi:hypothetical protein